MLNVYTYVSFTLIIEGSFLKREICENQSLCVGTYYFCDIVIYFVKSI